LTQERRFRRLEHEELALLFASMAWCVKFIAKSAYSGVAVDE
jgi:hypothetical protein